MLAPSPTLSPSQTAAAATPQRGFDVELLAAADAGRHAAAWAELVRRALEPNVFFEPEFAVPALANFGGSKRLRVLFVWDVAVTPRALVAVLPLALPKVPFIGACRVWVHAQAVLGTPLLDRTCAAAAFDVLFDAVTRIFPGLALLVLPRISKTGPTFGLLQAHAARRHLALTVLSEHARALLQRPFADPLSSGAAAELRRQRRRLADLGHLAYRSFSDAPGVAQAMEDFLKLEASGWKGRRNSALASSPASTAFARSMAGLMAAAGKIRVDRLECGARAVAMGIILQSGARAYFWKIAYDEAFAARSPGVLLTQDLTRLQIADPAIEATDSCAIPDHPMINRLWPDRLALADVALPLHMPQASAGSAIFAESLHQGLRRSGKILRDRLRAKRTGRARLKSEAHGRKAETR